MVYSPESRWSSLVQRKLFLLQAHASTRTFHLHWKFCVLFANYCPYMLSYFAHITHFSFVTDSSVELLILLFVSCCLGICMESKVRLIFCFRNPILHDLQPNEGRPKTTSRQSPSQSSGCVNACSCRQFFLCFPDLVHGSGPYSVLVQTGADLYIQQSHSTTFGPVDIRRHQHIRTFDLILIHSTGV